MTLPLVGQRQFLTVAPDHVIASFLTGVDDGLMTGVTVFAVPVDCEDFGTGAGVAIDLLAGLGLGAVAATDRSGVAAGARLSRSIFWPG